MLVAELYPQICQIFQPRPVTCSADDHRLLLCCVLAEASLGLSRMRASYLARFELSDGTLFFSEGLKEEKQGVDCSWGSRSYKTATKDGVMTGYIRETRAFFGKRYDLDFQFGPYRQACMDLARANGLVFQDRLMALDLGGLQPLPPLQQRGT